MQRDKCLAEISEFAGLRLVWQHLLLCICTVRDPGLVVGRGQCLAEISEFAGSRLATFVTMYMHCKRA